ncbi:MAG: S41 family peptidase [Candidatus Eisenbacteria bacterium]
MRLARLAPLALAVLFAAPVAHAATTPDSLGYYRYPAVHGGTVVFTAEGDLWKVGLDGGVARRLTTHPGQETNAAISPDGKWLAFTATYDGPTEAYVMPVDGGLPKRLTYDGDRSAVVGWTPDGAVLVTTRKHSTLPNLQLVTVRPADGERTRVPLAQASEGAYDGRTLVFTRYEAQPSHTKRYRGGRVQQLWRWDGGRDEARALFAGDSATSRNPMVWNGRVYFIGDRDLNMNLWSCRTDGSDLQQLTRHKGFDVRTAAMDAGKIVYQLGADLRVYDAATGADAPLAVRLASDFDQLRERWVANPVEWVSAAHLSPDGDRVVLTARGQVYVAPVEPGRFVQVTRDASERWRSARFLPGGKQLVGLSDASGEIELWTLPANGVGAPAQKSRDGKVIRWDGVPSPDGKYVAHTNRDQELWILELATGKQTKVVKAVGWADVIDVTWSPDSRWIAFARPAANQLQQVMLYSLDSGKLIEATSDRWDSYSPAWTPDGQWLYFLSDRTYESLVGSIWGSRQPEPFYDGTTKIYALSLRAKFRSPFAAPDELQGAGDDKPAVTKPAAGGAKGKPAADAAKPDAPAPVTIDLDGLQSRLIDVPAGAGNFSGLTTDGKHLWYLEAELSAERKTTLKSYAIGNDGDEPGTVLADVRSYELSADRKKMLVRKADAFYVFDAGAKGPGDLAESRLPLDGWQLAVDPRVEFAQMFREAWRLERDYFYDTALHGVDWKAMYERYRPLAARVTDRAELADVFQQMIGELVALHMYVYGGDNRTGTDNAPPATLGAEWVRDEAQNGWRIVGIHHADPDTPDALSPLEQPGVDVRVGDVVTAIDGVSVTSVMHPSALLRRKAGKEVLLTVKRGGASHDAIVRPIANAKDAELRYDAWEYSRRLRVDSLGAGRIGYVHLRSMGAADMAQFTRDYYPIYQRDGLILDVRNNTGGNIDAWVLSRLIRRSWMWWQPRTANAFGNMPFAFDGRMIVLVNERTASDGEAFAEGFRRLGLGKVMGTRTWGGEIWLSQDNFLADRGIATAAETGVFGPEGRWLIENHGVDPDIVVDNLPRATADGADAQLEAAVRELLGELARDPVKRPAAPPYPNKSVR